MTVIQFLRKLIIVLVSLLLWEASAQEATNPNASSIDDTEILKSLEELRQGLEEQRDHKKQMLFLKENYTYFQDQQMTEPVQKIIVSLNRQPGLKEKLAVTDYVFIKSVFAHMLVQQQNQKEALEAFREVYTLAQPPEHLPYLLDAARSMSFLKKEINHEQTWQMVQSCIRMHRQHGQQRALADFILEFSKLIETQEALAAYDMISYAQNIYRQLDDVDAEMLETYRLKGQTMFRAGNMAKAGQYFEKAVSLADTSKKTSLDQHIALKTSLARFYFHTRMFDQATETALRLKALTESHPTPQPQQLSVMYGFLSRHYIVQQQFDSALVYRQKSMELDKKLFPENSMQIKSGYYALSEIFMQMGDFEKALHYVHKNLMLEFPEPFGTGDVREASPTKMFPGINVNGILQNLMLKVYLMEVLYSQTQEIQWLKDAREHYSAADFYIKILQESMLERNFLALLQINRAGYEAASQTLKNLYLHTQDPKHLDDLYYFSTALKGRFLAFQNYRLNPPKATTSAAEKHLQELGQKVNQLRAQLTTLTQESQINQMNDSIFDLLVMQSILKQTQIASGTSTTPDFDMGMYHVSAQSIRQSIEPQTALIEYVLMQNTLQIFVFTTDSLYYTTVAADQDYQASLNSYRRSLKTGRTLENETLHQYLIDPIYHVIRDKTHLVFIPDDNLFAIPMEALSLNDKDILIDRFSVSYHYSGYFWKESHDRTRQPENPQITLFAPVFSEEHGILSDASPYRNSEILEAQQVLRGAEQLQALPFSRVEVENVARMFEEKNLRAYLFLESDANEKQFRRQSHTDIVHIATHGISNRQQPEHSGLFFTQDPKVTDVSDHTRDGFLHLNELYDLSFDVDLAVLSACKSGEGQIFAGEGFFGLPRGFILAGARNLVVSLWKIHDEKTADMITRFYYHLLQGHNYAQSMRLAKLEMIDKGFLPIDWGGIILIGK